MYEAAGGSVRACFADPYSVAWYALFSRLHGILVILGYQMAFY